MNIDELAIKRYFKFFGIVFQNVNSDSIVSYKRIYRSNGNLPGFY